MAYKRTRKDFEADFLNRESPFVVYGTALPPLDSDMRDDGSYVPVWKQEVTDDRGRKRLHGAFTGGFSAGYFNTVGSKEGWAPATFVSSRSNRAKEDKNAAHHQQQRPEDFMDEEDLRELEESRSLATAEAYTGFGTVDDPNHKNSFTDLFRPADDSMGVKLLTRMGWKHGQGIGPRVKRRVDVDDEHSATHLFAPEDAPMISFIKKSDHKGLGYDGELHTDSSQQAPARANRVSSRVQSADEDGAEDEDGRPGLSFASRRQKQKKPARAAFGVGVLNDTGSDDEDPYTMGPKISYNRTLGGDKKAKRKQAVPTEKANPLLKDKPVFISKKLTSIRNALRKCHDGRLPLDGFVLADELDAFATMSLNDDKYKPPEVPADWTPSRILEGEKSPDVSDAAATYQSTAEVAKKSSHTASTRATALGETRLPGKSVFDFLTPSAREKLVKATGKSNLPPALSEQIAGTTAKSGVLAEAGIEVPYLDQQTASSALTRAAGGGFMPYAENLPKRDRYKFFLEIAAGIHPPNTLPAKLPVVANNRAVSNEDWLNELYEFVRAAEVFRPMSGAIASRFTSSSTSTSLNPSATTTDTDRDSPSLMRKPTIKAENPAEVAAKLGMFGIMTRSVGYFQPTRLVCKRFGVDMPVSMNDPSLSSTTTTHASDSMQTDFSLPIDTAVSVPSTTLSSSSSTRAGDITLPTPSTSNTQNDTRDHDSTALASEPKVVIDADTNEALEQVRPGQAVFRAIFGDSDSDSDSDSDGG